MFSTKKEFLTEVCIINYVDIDFVVKQTNNKFPFIFKLFQIIIFGNKD